LRDDFGDREGGTRVEVFTGVRCGACVGDVGGVGDGKLELELGWLGLVLGLW